MDDPNLKEANTTWHELVWSDKERIWRALQTVNKPVKSILTDEVAQSTICERISRRGKVRKKWHTVIHTVHLKKNMEDPHFLETPQVMKDVINEHLNLPVTTLEPLNYIHQL